MADINHSLRSGTNTPALYLAAIVAIVAIAVVGSVLDPERSVSILSFTGSVLVALLAILKGLGEYRAEVNSKMDELLKVKAELADLAGEIRGRAAQKAERNAEDSAKNECL